MAEPIDASLPEERMSLGDLCHTWEQQPLADKPLVFFTVGDIVVLSSSSGVPEIGSLCRQFWAWLGQSDEYDPRRIAFTLVNGQDIHMSVPNLTQFVVKLKHEPNARFEFIITLHPKRGNNPQKLTAQSIMTQDYPETPFKAKIWWKDAHVLTTIDAEVRVPGDTSRVNDPELFILGFYSKASDLDSAASTELTPEEEVMMRGSGRRLMCQMLDSIQWTHVVKLDACGLSYRDQAALAVRAGSMQVDDIMQDLKENAIKDLTDLNPHLFEQWNAERIASDVKYKHFRKRYANEEEQKEADLASLRNTWVEIRGNENLVKYYIRSFGFKPVQPNSFTCVPMQARPEVIRAHCSASAKKDGGLW